MGLLSDTYARAYPWSVQIVIDDVTYSIRRLDNADVSALMLAPQLPPEARAQYFAALFDGESPPCAWDDIQASALVAILVNYYLALLRRELEPPPSESGESDAAAAELRPLNWTEVVLMLQQVAPGTPLSELWETPADATIRIIGDAARLRKAVATGGAAGQGAGPRQMPDGTIVETFSGPSGIEQLKNFIRRTQPATKPAASPRTAVEGEE